MLKSIAVPVMLGANGSIFGRVFDIAFLVEAHYQGYRAIISLVDSFGTGYDSFIPFFKVSNDGQSLGGCHHAAEGRRQASAASATIGRQARVRRCLQSSGCC